MFRDSFQILVPDTQSEQVKVHTFCSPDLFVSGTLGPAVNSKTCKSSYEQSTPLPPDKPPSKRGRDVRDTLGIWEVLQFSRSLPEQEIFRFVPRSISLFDVEFVRQGSNLIFRKLSEK